MTCGLCKKPIRGDDNYTTDHYKCAADMDQSWARDVAEADRKLDDLSRAVRTILRGFQDGVFVRSTDGDVRSDWAVRLLPFIAALGEAEKIVGFWLESPPADDAVGLSSEAPIVSTCETFSSSDSRVSR